MYLGAKYNPEIMWCQPDPNCIAVCADVLDMSKERDSIMDIPNANRFINTSFRDDSNSQVLSYIQYVVLCRINTGISCLHSVQIGPDENASIRLEVITYYEHINIYLLKLLLIYC
jgi:hypothetical protein